QCNCGHLAQTLTGRGHAEIHVAALQRGGEWEDRVREYCPTSGLAIDEIIRSMLDHGLTTGDLADLEDLRDDRVLRRLPWGRRYLRRSERDVVIEYLGTWAALLEEELRARAQAAKTSGGGERAAGRAARAAHPTRRADPRVGAR